MREAVREGFVRDCAREGERDWTTSWTRERGFLVRIREGASRERIEAESDLDSVPTARVGQIQVKNQGDRQRTRYACQRTNYDFKRRHGW